MNVTVHVSVHAAAVKVAVVCVLSVCARSHGADGISSRRRQFGVENIHACRRLYYYIYNIIYIYIYWAWGR